jgi:type IV pilus assembly protein PilY1
MSIKKLACSFTAFALSFFISLSAFGDDLEIYLGTSESQVTYNPNVLFIMDTSGSMSNRDGGSQSRMQRVQIALNQALENATNINAGLMRFSDYGGPILFPVRGIDTPVQPEIILPVKDSQDDAYEIDGNPVVNSNQLILTQGTSEVTTGLRYQNVNIPQGATITSARVRFISSQLNTSASTLTIYAEDEDDSAAFTTQNDNISGRDKTSNSLEWVFNNAFPLAQEITTSPDISHVIQEVIGRSGWCGGNDLSLIIEGESSISSSNRRAFSYDEGDSRSPQLIITYDESTATGCTQGSFIYQVDEQNENAEERPDGTQSTGNELTFRDGTNEYIGVRFKNLNIPQGAEIVDAHIIFTAHSGDSSNGARMRIRGVAEDDPNNFSPYTRYLLSNKPKTGASVTWDNIGAWTRNETYETPSVRNIVQEIVNRSGWQANNEMMFVFDNFTNAKRGAYTFRGRASGAPQLVIEYKGNAVPGSQSTVRQSLISRVNELSPSGFTPIVDTLYEATSYYGGLNVDYGRKRGEADVSNSVRRATRVSNRLSYIGADPVRPFGCTDANLNDTDCMNEFIPAPATYISPIQDLQCQTNNHIVLLSDGEANNNHSVSKIQNLLGRNCTGNGGERCGVDLVSDLSSQNTSPIDARIITHTIGFAANSTANNFLNRLALQGGGGFYEASNSEDLVNVFETILRQVKDVNTTFVSPGVAVNQLNRLTHRDELYFALFRPAEGALWPGNLKKYKIAGDVILDKNGSPAVDGATGFFKENSHSYWSPLADGNDVREGGAISRLDLVRNLYTFDDTPGPIAVSGNAFNESNSSITLEDMGLETRPNPEILRNEILKWARGVDVLDADGDGSTTDINLMMGDPIHSQPVIVNYSETDSAILVATNHGFLHSFDSESGEENFAIMPKELLPNLEEFYRNGSTFNHIYGLDGDMVYREVDEKKWLYVGQRRGGNNYYVFDITQKDSPKLVFKIDGGEGAYANMGQSWSRPILTKVDVGGSVRNVMIIGGGYDEDQDTKSIRSADMMGNSVYMIDADTGSLIWSASDENATLNLPEMKYSIPAHISVIDRDNDGVADHMYVADMGGQLFRLDIYNGNPVNELVKGQRLADFGGDSETENRRFFYGPDVSEVTLGDAIYYAVAIGSGFRAGPLNTTIEDNFYMIKDEGVFQRDTLGQYTFPSGSMTAANLYDATNHLLTSPDNTERDLATADFANKDGWYIRLTNGGEKVLSSPLILDYKVFFTTYLPASSSESLCAPPTGNSRAYLVNLFNGNSLTDLNQNGERDRADRSADLAQTGIAPDTRVLFPKITNPVVCLGAECVSAAITTDADGNENACTSDFECLAQNIYGRFERVRKESWKTEIERNQ